MPYCGCKFCARYCYTSNFTGCHVVAPSDMMDNRVAAIKRRLADAGLAGKVSECLYITFNTHAERERERR